MKVITLTQPWATLVAIGAKGIETRPAKGSLGLWECEIPTNTPTL